jgi:hypothetical protein
MEDVKKLPELEGGKKEKSIKSFRYLLKNLSRTKPKVQDDGKLYPRLREDTLCTLTFCLVEYQVFYLSTGQVQGAISSGSMTSQLGISCIRTNE